MKNLKQICATLFIACACTLPAWATSKNYCDEVINNGGVNYHLTFEKTGTNAYRAIVSVEGNHKLYKYPYSSPQGYASHTGEGTSTVTITYNSTPTNTSFNALCLDGTSSPVNFNFYSHENKDINWNNVCTPPDTHDPVISSVVAQSTTQTSITVRVTATDNQTNDTGVASITVTRHDNSQSQTENIYPVVKVGSVYRDFVFSGLSAGTTYTFDITVTDAAGRTASTSRNLTTQAAVVDNTPPTISSAAAANIKATTADIRVQATDNIGVTRVVIKNGEETIKNQAIGATTSLNQAFTLTGLTKNTTYNNIKVIVYDARPNGSNIYNVSSFTTKNTNTIYFVKSGTSSEGWWGATPKVHYGGGWETTTFPGINMTNTGMTNCDGTEIWRAEIPDNTNVVVFSNGNDTQGHKSSDQTPLANQYFNWERNAWYSPENLYILGEGDKFGNWTRSDAFKFSTWNGSTPTSVTKTLRLTGNSYYQFKIQYYDGVNEYWRGNSGTMESNCTKWLMNQENNCQIHTGSTGNYIFTYDFTANKLSVTYPVPDVGCEGTSTTCTSGGTNFVHYTLKYIGGNIVFSVRSTTANALQTCKISYAKNTSGQDAVTNVGMTVTNGEATCTLPATGAYASGTMYFYFTYRSETMWSEGSSASGFSSGAFQYNIGGCPLDDGIPYMLSASESSKTSTSVTLNVSGIVNIDGVENSTTQYVVSTNGGSTWSSPLTASEGKITISDLEPNTEYTFVVKTKYGDVVSENSKSVTVRTNRASNCGPVTWYQDNTTNYPIEFELKYDEGTGDLTIEATSQTAYKLDYFEALSSLWTGGKLATIDGSGKATVTIPAAQLAAVGTVGGIRFVYSMTDFGGNVQTAGNNDVIYPAVIYYVVGECEYSAETNPPCMNSASVDETHSNSVTINVSATDAESTVTKFYTNETGDRAFTISDGKITIDGLTSCTNYTFNIYCHDRAGNSSKDNTTPSCQTKSVTFTTTASVGNMALHKPATVSHTEEGDNTAAKAVDGDLGTRWATGSGHNNVANWIQVDLGSVQVVNSVRIYWQAAFSRNYEILFSYDGSNYYSVYHQTTDPSLGNGVNDYQNHPLTCPTPTRYVKVQAAVGSYDTGYGISIWELEVYGSASCAGLASTPHMLCAETVSVGTDEAVIAVSSVDAETAPQNMKYIVSATSGEAGHKQLTSVYTFTASQYIAGTLKHLKVGGLLPDVPYSLRITAVDAAGIASDNSLALDFRTAAGGGACTWEDNEKQDCAGSQDFSEGYTVSIENNTPDDDHFTITTTLKDTKSGLVAYFQRIPNFAGDPCGVDGEQQMNTVVGQERTYSLSVDKSALPDEIDFRIKFAYAGGLANTKPIHFDKNATCSSGFVIYHYDDAPTSTAVTSSDASSIAEPILYYRHFTPDAFEDAAFPFAIDSVRIYDTEDHRYYKLTAQYNNGSTQAGNFYLRVFPAAGSNGASFTNSWEDGTNALPQKNTAYSIRFPNDGGYYANKYILFHGHPGAIETSLTLGTRPTTDDLYKVYPNPTMSAQSLGVKAYVTTDRSENLYWKEDNATVQAFETYVLANENTMKRMRRIAAWSEGDDTTTSIEDVRDAMAIHACIAVYTLTGQKIGEWHNCSFGDAEDALALRAQKGCYILVSEGQTRKMIIQ